jgi:hypothetical protein
MQNNSLMQNGNPIKSFTKSNNISKNIIKNNTVKPDGINKLIVIGILIGICILIYIIIIITHYYTAKCENEKKPFFKYIIDFSNSNICINDNSDNNDNNEKNSKDNNIELRKINIPIIQNEEVFHIANQDYTYEQGKCKCESYGAKLATKNQITDSYNKGANWCTYGWSEKQEAYYPVQKCYWDDVKKENSRLPDKEKKYCGIPGINGGFFSNPNLKFGVNCYGVKPKGNNMIKEKKPFCEKNSIAMNFCKLESNFEASHKLDTDEIVGFNNEKWNM